MSSSGLRPLGEPLVVALQGGGSLECSAFSRTWGFHELRLEFRWGSSPAPLVLEGPRQWVEQAILDPRLSPLLYSGGVSLPQELDLPQLYSWVVKLCGVPLPLPVVAHQPKRAPTPPRGVVIPTPLPACPPPAPVEREELAIEEEYLAPYRVEVEVEVLPGGVALLRAHLCDGVILSSFSPEQRRSWPHVSWEIGQAVDAWYAESGGAPNVFTQSGLRYALQTYAHSRVMIHENLA